MTRQVCFICAFFRWGTVAWNKKIMDQMEFTEEQLEKDATKFQKNLQTDQANFEDRLDTLEVVIPTLSHTFTCLHLLSFS